MTRLNIAKMTFLWLFAIFVAGMMIAFDGRKYDGLLKAVQSNDIRYVSICLSDGMDVNHSYQQGNTLLHFARSEEMGMVLVSHGALVNAKNHRGNTPLHAASDQGRVGLVVLLLNRGADVNLPNDKGQTPLFWAVQPLPYDEDDFRELFVIKPGGWDDKTEITIILMEHGANAHHKDNKGRDIISHAMKWNNLDTPTMQAVAEYLSKP